MYSTYRLSSSPDLSLTPEIILDEEFKKHVMEFMDEVVVQKFDKREGDAADFYEVDKAS